MDYRIVSDDLENLSWRKARGRWVASSSVRVQTPTCRCRIRDTRGFQQISLTIDDPGFVAFVERVEAIARHFVTDSSDASSGGSPDGEIVEWCASVNQWDDMRLNAFDGVLYFDAEGSVVDDPLGFAACACIVEVAGIWTTRSVDGSLRAGLRFNVVQVKEQRLAPRCIIELEDDDD